MKSKNLLELLKAGSFTIPLYLYRLKDNLKIDADTFMFLMYLTTLGNVFIFNPKKISENLNIDITKVMEYISNLSENRLISVDVIKNDQNVMEEYVNLDLFYEKINMILLDEINNEEKDSSDIFDTITKEFGRLLSPIEIEIVNAWLESNIPEELIHEALKEAIMNGVTNLRYIDKILYEWDKKGYKTKDDVLEGNRKFRENQDKKHTTKKEVFDYNWLEDDDDEE